MTLEQEKQQRILNAALEEFSKQGYDNASTNNIVKEAGIGKGMLFYYFNSKKELFNYLIEYGIKYVTEEYLENINEEQSDFIEMYAQGARVKKEAYLKNPYVFNFLGNIYVNKELPISKELEDKLESTRKLGFKKLFGNIDTSLFREDIEPQKIIRFIKWTMDGYEKELLSKLDGQNLQEVDMEPYWEEFYQYLEDLKKIYYK